MNNEAPISVTFSLTDPNEFPILFTIRGDEPKAFMLDLLVKSKWLKDNGFKPQVKTYGSKTPFVPQPIEYVPNRKCPTCGSPLIYADIKGKKTIKCSTNKWNKMLGKAEGCPFIEWSDKLPIKVQE